MVWLRLLLAPVCAAALFLGCSKAAEPPVRSPLQDLPTQAQPRLQTMELWIGDDALTAVSITAEIARSNDEIRTGMMFRTNVVEGEGMLFVMQAPHRASFWMMNCPSPLSCAYISPQGIIEELHDMEPFNTNSIVARADNILFVLETPQGWFARNGIRPGMPVRTEEGSLIQTFFKPRAP